MRALALHHVRSEFSGEMAEGEKTVEGVFCVEMVVVPVPMKPTFGRPERINKIEASFLDSAGDGGFEACQCVEGRGGGEQIRDGCQRHGHEAALGMDLPEKPVRNGGVERHLKL